jgi:hypothetical protein
MKGKIIVSLLFIAVILGMASCRKEDSKPPVITLNGSDSIFLPLPAVAGQGSYLDPGAVAEDEQDGNITGNIVVTNQVNPNRKGIYKVIYRVKDAAGNEATKIRIVKVFNASEKYARIYYNAVDSCGASGNNFISTVVSSDTVNRLVWIYNFGAYSNSIRVRATISDTGLTVPLGQYLDVGQTTWISAIYSPETGILNASAPSFRIKYQWSNGSTNGVCTSRYIP